MVRFLILLFLILSFSLSGCGDWKAPEWLKFGRQKEKAEPEEKVKATVLASVNGRIITLEDFTNRLQAYNAEIEASKDIPKEAKEDYLIKTAADKKRLLEGMIERELVVAEAIDRDLDKDEDIKQALKALKEQLLFAKLIDLEKNKVKVTAKEVENYYNLYKDAFTVPEERKVSMILVPTEAKAKEILIALLQGADFATLARTHSVDESASRGGDVGFITKTTPFPRPGKKTMFEKFEEVAFALELNEPSTIFKGPKGYYIIKVTEVKQARQQMLSEIFDDIEQGLMLKKQEDTLNNLVGNLRKSANIVVHEELLTNTN